MKRYCLLIFFLICRVCEAQNLVPNPSFEDTTTCPDGYGEVDHAIGWSSYKSTPDYFNECADTSLPNAPGAPYNGLGFQFAATGHAYCAIGMSFIGSLGVREYIGAHLLSNLVIGQKYYISFKTCLGDNTNFIRVGCNKMGVKFSTVPFSMFNPAPVSNSAHFYTDSIVTDTTNWTIIKGSFISDSAYSYVMIGNFFDDIHTDTLNLYPPPGSVYYLIDDVCVSTDSLTCNPPLGINETTNERELILFPNPFTDRINITAKRNEVVEISFYDVTARKIFNQSFTSSTTINTEQLVKGIYLYEVRNKNGVIKKGKVVKD